MFIAQYGLGIYSAVFLLHVDSFGEKNTCGTDVTAVSGLRPAGM